MTHRADQQVKEDDAHRPHVHPRTTALLCIEVWGGHKARGRGEGASIVCCGGRPRVRGSREWVHVCEGEGGGGRRGSREGVRECVRRGSACVCVSGWVGGGEAGGECM